MKMRPVSVNALVLELLIGTSNGYFELVVFNSLDVTHRKKKDLKYSEVLFPKETQNNNTSMYTQH